MQKLLVVVDYQVDFVNGILGFPKALSLEEKIVDKILEYENNGYDIVFTLDTHYDNYMETEEAKKLPIPHCIKGSYGHEIFGEVRELSLKYPRFIKETFPSGELFKYLEAKKYDEIALCGLVTNICVISNAVICKAANPNAHIVVLKDLVSSFDLDAENHSFKVMESLHIELK